MLLNICANICVQQTRDRKCVSLCLLRSLLRTKKWQPSASLSYSDMTHTMSTASDGCSSFNCMSALNDGILNSYTLHTIAFSQWQRPGEAAEAFRGHMEREAEPRLSDRELSALSLYQNGCYTVLKLQDRHMKTHKHAHTPQTEHAQKRDAVSATA